MPASSLGPAVEQHGAHTTYAYSLDVPTTELRAGDTLKFEWRPRANGSSAQHPPKAQLCFALVGSYASVADAKAAPYIAPTCPLSVTGAAFVSDVVEVDPWLQSSPSLDFVLPKDLAPGPYNLTQVSVMPGSVVSAGGVVRIVAP